MSDESRMARPSDQDDSIPTGRLRPYPWPQEKRTHQSVLSSLSFAFIGKSIGTSPDRQSLCKERLLQALEIDAIVQDEGRSIRHACRYRAVNGEFPWQPCRP